MRRSRLTKLLNDYVAGDLDADARAEVERQLAADPKARALHDEIRDAHEALCVLRERPEPPHRAEDALPRIQAAIATASFTERPVLPLEGQGTRYYRRIAMAATLLFAVTAGLFAYKFASGSPDAPEEVEQVEDLRPTPEERGLVRVADDDRLMEAGRQPEGIPGDELLRQLERLRRVNGAASDLYVAPVDNALPPVPFTPEER